MSATIIMFPGTVSEPPAVCLASLSDSMPISAGSLGRKFEDHFLPICQASVDLLKADERDFEARCRRMLDSDGTVMLDELCAELQTVGAQMRILVDGLDLTRARLRTAMARLAPPAAG